MNFQLDGKDLELILESLRYTKERFSTYDGYPSEDFRKERIEQVERTLAKLRSAKSTTEGAA